MEIELRDPNIIMKLSRLGSFHQSKLSFLRSFLSEFKDWEYKRDLFDLDKDGFGVVVYSFKKKDRVYSLICFANKIQDDERSDRVIATKWDAAFTLYDGIPGKKDIERLKQEVPKQEVGRLSYKELTLSRANKSVRVFDHVVESLSNGKQPNLDLLEKVGYLYRTTAVYGSGKFGLADRFRIKNREEINGPFRLEMMLVYLVRQFTFDQVNHVAQNKNPEEAVKLDSKICKNLGIGNSTGLGMAPFIVNHPTLLNNWILCRELALKKIREIKKVKTQDSDLFKNCVRNSIKNITSWNTESEYQLKKIKSLLKDVTGVLIPGGFGKRGTEGKIAAIKYARLNNIPFFGICFGMQMAVIEAARNLLNIKNASSSEFGNNCTPVVGLLEEWQKGKKVFKGSEKDLGGTMRLGLYDAVIKNNSLISKIYSEKRIKERHRHRYEVNIKYKKDFEKKGLIFSALSPDGSLPEIIELNNHPWFVGVQFHPEFKSRPFTPHPLFSSFIKAANLRRRIN